VKTPRRRFVLALACAFPVAAQDSRDAGLVRLEALLQAQLSRPKGALPLPWRESILTPDPGRLVWRSRSLTVRPGGDVFRVALDPVTRWYFVAQAAGGSARPRFFGPIEETSEGQFVEALVIKGRKPVKP